MTQDEQSSDLALARNYLVGTDLTAERCTHETVTETALWIYDRDKHQIGSITRLSPESTSKYKWEVTRMWRGMPTARWAEVTLHDCIENLKRYTPQPRKNYLQKS
jgi:hypothetical protein